MPDSQSTNAFLQKIYSAYQRKNSHEIERLVKELPDPQDKTLLAGLNSAAWESIASAVRQREKIVIASVIAMASLITVGLFFVLAILAWRAMAIPAPIPIVAGPTAGLTPTSTEPAKPIDTSVPANTPTATDTPSPTATATQVPTSQYLQNSAEISPVLPGAYEEVWVLNDDSPAWESNAANAWSSDTYKTTDKLTEPYQYQGNKTEETAAFNVSYSMDVPQPVDGLYEILVMDTPLNSSEHFTYEVSLDGAPIEPELGTRQVNFISSKTLPPQKDPLWVSLGFYHMKAGQRLQIKTMVPVLPANSFFAVDRIVIGKISKEQDAVLSHLKMNIPKPLSLVTLLDDFNTIHEIYNGNSFVEASTPKWEFSESSNAWEDKFQYLGAWGNTIKVTWGMPARSLLAGKYQLWVKIPDTHASVAEAEYYLLVNGKKMPSLVGDQKVVQSTSTGQWVPAGEYSLGADATVQVVMEVKKGVAGEIGIDAVALVRVP